MIFLFLRINTLTQEMENMNLKFYYLKDEIDHNTELIKNLNAVIDRLVTQTKNYERIVENLQEQVENQNKTIKSLQEKISAIEKRQAQKSIVYPTFEALVNFIREDRTNNMPYIENYFMCTEFSNMFVENFRNKGYYSCVVYILFENDTGHSIVAVLTTDKGILFVEPQTDQIITNLNVGDNYCSKVNWNCNWRIRKINHCF